MSSNINPVSINNRYSINNTTDLMVADDGRKYN